VQIISVQPSTNHERMSHGPFAQLTGLWNGVRDVGQLEPMAKPLSLVEMLRHHQRADIYLVY